MAELIIDPLKKVQVDDGDRTGSVGALGTRHFFIEAFQDVTPVQQAGQFVQLGKFFDPLIGRLEFNSAPMERSSHRVSEKPNIRALSDRQDKRKCSGKPFRRCSHWKGDWSFQEKEYCGDTEPRKNP